jgi:DNA-binding CsgD family transcriptional regulator
MNRRGRPPYPDVLTPRQWQVLALLREGLSNEQIALRLGISVDGVKFHVSEILSKLGVGSRNEAAQWDGEQRQPAPSAYMAACRRSTRALPPGARGYGTCRRVRCHLRQRSLSLTAKVYEGAENVLVRRSDVDTGQRSGPTNAG